LGGEQLLEHIDDALESFLRASVPLSATDIDVSFEAPDRDWSAKLSRPTVNLFLWDLRRSAQRSTSGMQTVEQNGRLVHQPALPVVELRYVVTAWTSEHADERELLSGLLRALLRHDRIPRDHLGPGFDDISEPTLLIARSGEDHMDVFKALEGQVKPGINIVVSTPFDVGAGLPAGPPVTLIETTVGQFGHRPETRRRVAGEVLDAESRAAVGAVVRTPADATRVNNAGRFLIRAEAGDEIVLELPSPVSTIVPEAGGVRFD
jgi:hypothetical protein